jgi:hypothetical protein
LKSRFVPEIPFGENTLMLYLHNTNETTGVLKQDYKEGSNVVNN